MTETMYTEKPKIFTIRYLTESLLSFVSRSSVQSANWHHSTLDTQGYGLLPRASPSLYPHVDCMFTKT